MTLPTPDAPAALRRRIWGWYFFDWASQPYHTLLVTFVFGPFFAAMAVAQFLDQGLPPDLAGARAQSLWSWCLTLSGLVIAFGAPLIGALADTTGRKRLWIAGFSLIYVAGACGLWGLGPDTQRFWPVLLCFGIGLIGAEYALIFVNSQLPSLGSADEVGRLSGSGFAFGYLGGLLALAVMLLLFTEQPDGRTLIGLAPGFGLLDAGAREGTRIVGPLVALWYALFMIPYFLWVPDTAPRGGGARFRDAVTLLRHTLARLRVRRSLCFFLGSSMLYRDALNGLYSFGGVYARLVLQWDIVSVGLFGIAGGLAAALFCFAGGRLDSRFGPRPVIAVSVCGLVLVCAVMTGMSRTQIFGLPLAAGSRLPDILFFGCGALIGGFGGVLQSSSRSLMARHTDPAAPTESFGLYGLCGRATAFLAPLLIGIATTMSGSARMGFLPVLALFLFALLLLRWVQAEGDRETWNSG